MGEHAVLAHGKSVEIEAKVYSSLYVAMCAGFTTHVSALEM
jgi:hypothetical protein